MSLYSYERQLMRAAKRSETLLAVAIVIIFGLLIAAAIIYATDVV